MERRLKPHTLTSADAVRHFPALLERVAAGEGFVIQRDGRAIAELAPAPNGLATLRTLSAALADLGPLDQDFADDLERIRAEQPLLPEDPWPF